MKREREHQAKLVIPVGHGPTFTATMTVTYDRSGQTSIVEETLTATIVERVLSLIGVNYSYVQRGASVSYSLDSFNLSVGGDGKTLLGKAVLRHGVRDVSFARIQSGSAL
jgi:hypothetical protein